MKCHVNNKDNKDNKDGHKHSPLKYMLHMILCCGLPIVILVLLPLITRFSQSTGSVMARIVPFICPIMMIGMMAMMFGNKKSSCCDKTNSDKTNNDNTNSDISKEYELNKPVE